MSVGIRRPAAGEADAYHRAIAVAFGAELPAGELERLRSLAEGVRRDLAAYDGGRIVGTASAWPFLLSVPGGEAPCAGVTAVGVAPTHRRRGILRRLMRRQLDDLRESGEPLAALWASEGGIYGRFGYGLASANARIDADRDRAGPGGRQSHEVRVRLVDDDEAARVLPRLYARARASTAGFPSRTERWWRERILHDGEWERDGAGPLFRAVLALGGEDQAYALYRVRSSWADGIPGGVLQVQEELAASADAWRELWRFLFGIDLVARVRTRTMPADHPLFLLSPEPARLRFRLADGLFLRLVDLPGALAARTYAGDGGLALEVEDAFCPWNAGRWELAVSGGQGGVRRARRRADLRLAASQLAAVYLGGFSFARLARAGCVEELRRGALARADALFATDRAPWCPEVF